MRVSPSKIYGRISVRFTISRRSLLVIQPKNPRPSLNVLLKPLPTKATWWPTFFVCGRGRWFFDPLNPPVNGGKKSAKQVNGVKNCSMLLEGGENCSLPVDGEGWGGVVSHLSGRPTEVEGIPIEAIRPGDFVFGHDGRPQRVVHGPSGERMAAA